MELAVMTLPGKGEALTFRPVTPEDDAFLLEVYAASRAEEMGMVPWTGAQKRNFLVSQFRAQATYYRDHFPDAEFLVILDAGVPAGRLYVDRRADEIELIDIALLPEWRGAGIGGALVAQLQEAGARSGRPVRLYVEHQNRARRLYERLGFRPVGDAGVYVRMEWRPEPEGDGRVS